MITHQKYLLRATHQRYKCFRLGPLCCFVDQNVLEAHFPQPPIRGSNAGAADHIRTTKERFFNISYRIIIYFLLLLIQHFTRQLQFKKLPQSPVATARSNKLLHLTVQAEVFDRARHHFTVVSMQAYRFQAGCRYPLGQLVNGNIAWGANRIWDRIRRFTSRTI
ncbi:regulator of nonsense transcripts 1, partial [Trypanosoma cruzi]